MKVSVLIVTRHRPNHLTELLLSLKHQTRPPDEIVLVENHTKKTLAPTLHRFPELPVKYLLESKINIAHARNTALAHATSDIFAFIDDDCLADTHWVEIIHNTFTNRQLCLALTGRSLNLHHDNSYAQAEQIMHDRWFSQYYPLDHLTSLASGIFLNTRNLALRSSVVTKYQLRFNPQAPPKIEDTDFGITLYRHLPTNPLHCFYDPTCIVHHHNSTTLTEFITRRFISGRGKHYLDTQYPGWELTPPHPPSISLPRSLQLRILLFLERQIHRLGYAYQANVSSILRQ
jgi:glycosyltransferase involved in cell wall biosynthesis